MLSFKCKQGLNTKARTVCKLSSVMALLEENEAVKHQSKQSSQIDDILKSVNTLESKKLDLARKCIKDVPCELTRLHKLEVIASEV